MNKTPRANRTHIGIYGKRNAGKSSLLNAIVGQEIAIVSDVKGTTTDPVNKTMELLPYGPVVFIDTAGLDDAGILGDLRVKKSMKVLQRTDFAIYIVDATNINESIADFEVFKTNFEKMNIPYLLVFNKIDLIDKDKLDMLKKTYDQGVFVTVNNLHSVIDLKEKLIDLLTLEKNEPAIVGDLLNYGDTVVMVVPIDSEAPKGRLILPQVQMIRDCLDHGIKSYVVRDTELKAALNDLETVDLVITDSQAFKAVNKMVPDDILLTSFSILFAKYKSNDLDTLLDGIDALRNLKKNSKILISEACTHNTSHEDIGRFKIPALIEKKLGFKPEIEFQMGHDFPLDVKDYDLIVHCGACMVNAKTMKTRVSMCKENSVAITNYGLLIAYFTGILDRSVEIIEKKRIKEKII
jgi:[FeFe] hydrogenase H-cluster maturation GTPase HydF